MADLIEIRMKDADSDGALEWLDDSAAGGKDFVLADIFNAKERLRVKPNAIHFGDNTGTGNKLLVAEIGAANEPTVRFNVTSGKWEYSNDGTTFIEMGGVVDAQYVTLATSSGLSAERVLTGTANQITITDNGAGSTVVLSTPQNIHTAATPTFSRLTLSQTTGTAPLTVSSTTVVANLNADLLDGIDSGSFVQTSRTISTTTPLTGGGDLSGNRTLGIGGLTTNGTANYVIGSNSGATGLEYKNVVAGTGIQVNHTAGQIEIVNTGSAGVSGSGTTNTIPRWSASTTLADSIIVESSGKIGINVAPATNAFLHVAGANSSISGGTGTVTAHDSSALAADNGGQIAFRGVYQSGGASAGYGGIKSGKSNATDSNLDTYLAIYTRKNGVGIGEAARFSPDGFLGVLTNAPTNILSLGGNSARTFWMERHTTANTAGNSLTIQAGSATSAATDKNGGNLTLQSGTATGTGSSSILLQPVTAGATGTADRSPATKVTVAGTDTKFDHQYYANEYNIGNSGTAFTVDWSNGNVQFVTLTGNISASGITLSNPKAGGRYIMIVKQDATGGRTLGASSWPAAVEWNNGDTYPTYTTTASRISVFSLIYSGQAAKYLAAISDNYLSS